MLKLHFEYIHSERKMNEYIRFSAMKGREEGNKISETPPMYQAF